MKGSLLRAHEHGRNVPGGQHRGRRVKSASHTTHEQRNPPPIIRVLPHQHMVPPCPQYITYSAPQPQPSPPTRHSAHQPHPFHSGHVTSPCMSRVIISFSFAEQWLAHGASPPPLPPPKQHQMRPSQSSTAQTPLTQATISPSMPKQRRACCLEVRTSLSPMIPGITISGTWRGYSPPTG